jgi:hypothetical protein
MPIVNTDRLSIRLKIAENRQGYLHFAAQLRVGLHLDVDPSAMLYFVSQRLADKKEAR